MPSSSTKQQHFMQMARAVKAGHRLKGLSEGTMAALHKAANSMTNKQLEDFSHVATRPKAKKG